MGAFNHPEWTKDKNIYEVNIRQYTEQGTINAFRAHLPRLKAMGVDILWLMPIHPIGEIERKGTLGSQYASQDYLELDPHLGDKNDLKQLIEDAHQQGMYVILDWVANHTAWDNVWTKQHPAWYKRTEEGELYPYTFTEGKVTEYWTDVVGLDYNQKPLWQAMTDAMAYWVKEFDFDGFRCDVAGLVPTPFWEFATEQLNQIKHLFMLAEWSSSDLHEKAFDMTYDWDFYDLMGEVATGDKGASDIAGYVAQVHQQYPSDAYRMLFTTNHDKNSWEASDSEYFGESFIAFSVLAATVYGMPLIYSGQESGLDKRLEFFEKDPIDWKQFEHEDFYRELLTLKRNNPALWNGDYGAKPHFVETGNERVVSFVREMEYQGEVNRVEVTINLSADEQVYRSELTDGDVRLSGYEWVISARGALKA